MSYNIQGSMAVAEREAVSRIQAFFIIVTLILMTAFYSVGCLSKSDPLAAKPVSMVPTVENNAGISKVIREHFEGTLGQIVSMENYNQVSAQAIVTLTLPAPDVARVYLLMKDGSWVIERVQKGVSLEEM